MTFTDPYQDSYPPSLWETPPPGLRAGAESYELPADVEHFTVDAVKEWVGEHPDEVAAVLEAEEARDGARVTLVDWLNAHLEEEDA